MYQSTQGFCPFSAAARVLFTSSACQWTFCARRSAKCSMPAPTVSLVMRSMRMKPPVSRLTSYGSKAIGAIELQVADADLVQLERRAGHVLAAC